jgi:hypothetical protein
VFFHTVDTKISQPVVTNAGSIKNISACRHHQVFIRSSNNQNTQVNTTMFTMFNLLTSKRNGIFSLIDL